MKGEIVRIGRDGVAHAVASHDIWRICSGVRKRLAQWLSLWQMTVTATASLTSGTLGSETLYTVGALSSFSLSSFHCVVERGAKWQTDVSTLLNFQSWW